MFCNTNKPSISKVYLRHCKLQNMSLTELQFLLYFLFRFEEFTLQVNPVILMYS